MTLALALAGSVASTARAAEASSDAAIERAGWRADAHAAASAVDEPDAHEASARGKNLVGAKGLGALAITRGRAGAGLETASHFGVSSFYEREVVARWLDLELNVGVFSATGGVHVPVDLLFKKAFHVHRRATPYLGAGPTLETRLEDERSLVGGLTASAGVYVWVTKNFGIDVELDYTLHFTDEGREHVPTFGVGPAAHF